MEHGQAYQPLAFLLEAVDNTVRTPEQAQAISAPPWLGMIPVPANAVLFYVLCVVAALEPRFGSFLHLRLRRPRPEVGGQLSA